MEEIQLSNNKILVIIPAFNEEQTILKVINDIRSSIPCADILVVNDGSHDNTSSIAHSQNVKVIDLPFNLGIGGAMQTGYIYADRNKYNFAVQVDADGQHDPKFIDNVLTPVFEGKCDMAIGSRYVSVTSYKSPICRRMGMIFFSWLINALTGRKVKDPTSGFRAVNSKIIHFFAQKYPTDYPEVEVLISLHKKGFTFCEVPVEMKVRLGGVSSITPIRSIYYMAKVSLALLVNLIRQV